MSNIDNLRSAVTAVESELAAAKDALAAAQQNNNELDGTILGLQSRIGVLEEENQRLRDLLANGGEEPPPEEPPSEDLVWPKLGACPIGGGLKLTPVVMKWGRNPARPVIGRPFDPDEWTPYSRPAISDMPAIVSSFKPRAKLAQSAIVKIGETLTEELDLCGPWHEPDVKYKRAIKEANKITDATKRKAALAKAESDLALWMEIKSQFNTDVPILQAQNKIKFKSIDIIGGWPFTSDEDKRKFVPGVTAQYLGVDIDGTADQDSGQYFNWADPKLLARINAMVMEYGYLGWFATEQAWGGIRDDKDKSRRAAAVRKQYPLILKAGAIAIIVFDFNNFEKEAFELPNEIAAVKESVPA